AIQCWRTARPDEHDVLAELIELLLIPRAESLAQPHQQQQRPDPPGDSEHGQERAQLVSPQRAQGLCEDLKNKPHGLTSATTVHPIIPVQARIFVGLDRVRQRSARSYTAQARKGGRSSLSVLLGSRIRAIYLKQPSSYPAREQFSSWGREL